MEEEKEIMYHVVDFETGEIVDDIGPGDKIIHKKEKNEDEIEYVKDFKKGANFVKLYDEIVPMLREKLTPSEFIFAISLAPYVSYNDCILRRTGHRNSKIIDAKELSELLGMDYSVVRRLISSLKKKGVIGQHETGSINKKLNTTLKKVYTVNPNIYFRGMDINETVEGFYKDSGWDIVDIETH